ncbi:hypothetical protein [Paenibacillus sp. GCM10027626]
MKKNRRLWLIVLGILLIGPTICHYVDDMGLVQAGNAGECK